MDKNMQRIYCKDTPAAMDVIRTAIKAGKPFRVINKYETFYGVGFDRWLRDGVADLNPAIEVLSMNNWENYPWIYLITPAQSA